MGNQGATARSAAVLRGGRSEGTQGAGTFPLDVPLEDSPLDPATCRQRLHTILEHAGCKRVRFHDLRHTCASLLLANGVSMKQLQIWLGHSTFRTTADIDAHLDVSAQMETGDIAGGLFAKAAQTEQ